MSGKPLELSFSVEGPPQPKERARRGAGGRWYTPKRTQQYERAVRGRASMAMMGSLWPASSWPLDARYRVTINAYFGDARRRDADNVGKAVLDALNGITWKDDSQVQSLTLTRVVDRSAPRTNVRIEVLT